jgi:hypothetical protein
VLCDSGENRHKAKALQLSEEMTLPIVRAGGGAVRIPLFWKGLTSYVAKLLTTNNNSAV